jgi:leucyl-tRNA synthetase
VLANEQVLADGTCERCGAEVTKRELTQWYFRTTAYAQELYDCLDDLQDQWIGKVVNAQRAWIGRSEGAHVTFEVSGHEPITVFTTRPDTLFGTTFMVVAVDAKLAEELCAPSHREAFEAYREQTRKLSDIDRQSTERPKTGVPLGVTAVNPLNGEELPVYAADYVLAHYGTGAIMAVPAHDQRDYDFAKAFDLPIRMVVDTGEPELPTVGDGVLVNSGPLDGLRKEAAIAKAIEVLAERGTGKEAVQYRLRDWLLSRQRFWGAPIPVVHCPDCGEVAVPDDQLPVRLPDDMKGADLQPKGQSPLASNAAWVNVPCPQCGGPAQRDTDTMDTFVDSSWYYLRYCSPHYTDGPFDPDAVRRWLPVTQYVGGVEHAILHLLYSRFFTKVLHDMGMIDFIEPFTALMNQGQVINQGKAMSKSLGNGVDLGGQLAQFGVDAVRLTIIGAGPPEDDIDWADVSPASTLKWLGRVVRLTDDVVAMSGEGRDEAVDKAVAKTVDEVTRLIDAQRLNVAIARFHELVNAMRKAADSETPPAASLRDGVSALAVLLSCYAPYTAEEVWSRLGHDVRSGDSVHDSSWPTFDPALLVDETVTCVVQVAGKVRDKLEVPPGISEADLQELALASTRVRETLDGRAVRAVVVRAPKLVNVVPA